MHRSIKTIVILFLAAISQTLYGAEELVTTVTEVAPGVYRVRAGDPKGAEIYRDFLADNFIGKGVAGFKLDEVDGARRLPKRIGTGCFRTSRPFPAARRATNCAICWDDSACRPSATPSASKIAGPSVWCDLIKPGRPPWRWRFTATNITSPTMCATTSARACRACFGRPRCATRTTSASGHAAWPPPPCPRKWCITTGSFRSQHGNSRTWPPTSTKNCYPMTIHTSE